MTEHEQHAIMLSRDRRAYLSLPAGITDDEWERLLAWLSFTGPVIVTSTTPVGATSDKPTPSPGDVLATPGVSEPSSA